MRLRMPASSSENAEGSFREKSVISVRVQPIITGTSAETGEALGKNGCCGRILPSTVGENPAERRIDVRVVPYHGKIRSHDFFDG